MRLSSVLIVLGLVALPIPVPGTIIPAALVVIAGVILRILGK